MDITSRSTKAQLALFLGLTANTAGQSLFLVVLPPLGRRIGFTDIETGAIKSISAVLLMISAPAWGYLSERIGRRPILLLALAAAAMAAVAYGVIIGSRLASVVSAVSALSAFVVVRAVQALATSGLLPAAQAYTADITAPSQRAKGMGTLGAAIGLGVIIGAALAWQVAGDAPALAFFIVAALAAVAVVSVFWLAPEPARREQQASGDARLSLRRIWPFLAITVVSISAYSIVQQVTALRLQDALGFTIEQSIAQGGAALLGIALAMIVVQACVVQVLHWQPARLLTVGAAIAALAMLICCFARTYTEITVTLILVGIGLGLMLPGNLASLSLRTGGGAQGKVAGINVVAQGLGQAIGPLAGAALHQLSPQVPFFAAAILLMLACGFAIVAWWPDKDLVDE